MATLSPEQIIVGYNDAVHVVRSRVETFARTAWLTAGAWRDGDVDRLVRLIVPRVQAGQVQTAQLTAAYLAALQTVRTGARVAAVPVARELVTSARGVAPEIVYRRPAATMYNALSKGATVSAAIDMGIKRLGSLVSTDHQLAKTTQARQSMSGSGFEFMRRTLTGRENCALCVIASTQRYRVQDLQPIHPACDCGSDVVEVGRDPGQIISPELLDLTHATIDAKLGYTDRGARNLGIGKTTSKGDPISDYTDLIVINQHGELGPVLAWRSDKFTSASDIAALAH